MGHILGTVLHVAAPEARSWASFLERFSSHQSPSSGLQRVFTRHPRHRAPWTRIATMATLARSIPAARRLGTANTLRLRTERRATTATPARRPTPARPARARGANPVVCTAERSVPRRGDVRSRRPALCSNPAKPDGVACNDGNACTQTDTCQAGRARGANPGGLHGAATSATTRGRATRQPAAARTRPSRTAPPATTATPARRPTPARAAACTGANPVVCTAQRSVPRRGDVRPGDRPCARTRQAERHRLQRRQRLHADRHLPGGALHRRQPGGLHGAAISATTRGRATRQPALCSNPAKPNGTACNDGNACTQTDTCQSGTCTRRQSRWSARRSDQCHDAGTCDPATGLCSNPAKTERHRLQRRQRLHADRHLPGGHLHAAPTPWSARRSDQCHDAGTCDPGNGPVLEPRQDGRRRRATTATPARRPTPARAAPAPAPTRVCTPGPVPRRGTATRHGPARIRPSRTAPCNDGNACTQTDTCQAGLHGATRGLHGSDQCHDAGLRPGTAVLEPRQDGRRLLQRRQRLHADRHLPGGTLHRRQSRRSARPAISATTAEFATRPAARARTRQSQTARRATTTTPARRPTPAKAEPARAAIRSSAPIPARPAIPNRANAIPFSRTAVRAMTASNARRTTSAGRGIAKAPRFATAAVAIETASTTTFATVPRIAIRPTTSA